MTTSPKTAFLSEILDYNQQIPPGKLAYFRARLKNRFHAVVLNHFAELKLNKADLARKLGKKPEQITRWLGSPGNWTLDTLSDLLLGMGCEPALSTNRLSESKAELPSQTFQPSAASLARATSIPGRIIGSTLYIGSATPRDLGDTEPMRAQASFAVHQTDQNTPPPFSFGSIYSDKRHHSKLAIDKPTRTEQLIAGVAQ